MKVILFAILCAVFTLTIAVTFDEVTAHKKALAIVIHSRVHADVTHF